MPPLHFLFFNVFIAPAHRVGKRLVLNMRLLRSFLFISFFFCPSHAFSSFFQHNYAKACFVNIFSCTCFFFFPSLTPNNYIYVCSFPSSSSLIFNLIFLCCHLGSPLQQAALNALMSAPDVDVCVDAIKFLENSSSLSHSDLMSAASIMLGQSLACRVMFFHLFLRLSACKDIHAL